MRNFIRQHALFCYLSSRLFFKILGTALLLTLIMEALTLLEQMTPILQRGLGIHGVIKYMLLRLPQLFSSILPLSVLIGSIITLTQLTIAYEMTILRAAGLSTFGLIKIFLPTLLFLSVVCIIFDDQITPRTEMNLAIWWNKTNPTPENNKSFWFYQGLTLTEIKHLAYGGNKILGLNIYERKDTDQLSSVLSAEQANYENGHWILSNAKKMEIKENLSPEFVQLTGPLTAPQQIIWDTPVTPRELVALSSNAIPQPAHVLLSQIHNKLPSKQPIGFLKTALWQRFFLPFTFIVMLMIAIPVTYIPPRAGLKSGLPVYCLGFGLLFIIFQGVLRALGNAGTLPAPMTVIPSILLFFLATSAVILRIEEK
ncbi:MAG: LptF/LptG family permease [Commensalibacter sp.]|nr:LptF/LptG family permease [Commensalibacter sp.]